MAELLGTLVAVYALFRLNMWGIRKFQKAPYNTWLVFSSGLAAGLTGILLSWYARDGSFTQAPAILLCTAAITVYHVWKNPTSK